MSYRKLMMIPAMAAALTLGACGGEEEVAEEPALEEAVVEQPGVDGQMIEPGMEGVAEPGLEEGVIAEPGIGTAPEPSVGEGVGVGEEAAAPGY